MNLHSVACFVGVTTPKSHLYYPHKPRHKTSRVTVTERGDIDNCLDKEEQHAFKKKHEEDWKLVVKVLDRVLFLLFLVTLVILLVLFFPLP